MGVINIKGYAAHFGKANRNGEIVTVRSFDDFFARQSEMKEDGIEDVIPVNFNHDPRKKVGVVKSFDVDEVGLIVEAAISESRLKRYGIEGYVNDGTIDAFSTEGYIDVDTLKLNADGTYTANVFDLTAVAIVANPADEAATFKRNHAQCVRYFGKEASGDGQKEKEQEKQSYITINQVITLL